MSVEDQLIQLKKEIAAKIAAFELNTLVRVETLEIDNRMRGVGVCAEHNITISADISE